MTASRREGTPLESNFGDVSKAHSPFDPWLGGTYVKANKMFAIRLSV
jgi:hypothetical protein